MYPFYLAAQMTRPPVRPRQPVAVNHSYLNWHHRHNQMSGKSSGASTGARNSVAYPHQVNVAVTRPRSDTPGPRRSQYEREQIEKLRRELGSLDPGAVDLSDNRMRAVQSHGREHESKSRKEAGEDLSDRRRDDCIRERDRMRSESERTRDRDTCDNERHETGARKEGGGAIHRPEDLKQQLKSYKHENDRLRMKLKQIEDTNCSSDRVKELQDENSKLKNRVKRRDAVIKKISSQNTSDSTQHSVVRDTPSDKAHHSTRRKGPPSKTEKPILRRKPNYASKQAGVKGSKACVIS